MGDIFRVSGLIRLQPRSNQVGRVRDLPTLTKNRTPSRVEDDRTPDLRRCERIRWVRWVIQNAPAHAEIDEWQNTRGTEVNTLLWFREEYLVVLARRQGYWLLRTAYCTEKSGRIRQLQRERGDFRRATGAGGQND